MYNDLTATERLYWTREVAELLDMKEVTVRKYARLLEKYDYDFQRNEQDQRGFFERDVMIMKRIQALSKTKGVTLEDAVKVVISDLPEKSTGLVTPPVTALPEEFIRHMQRYEVMIHSVQDLHLALQEIEDERQREIKELKKENEEMKELLINLSKEVNHQFKTRDEAFLNSVREIFQEDKKEREKENESKKRGFLSRIFGKE